MDLRSVFIGNDNTKYDYLSRLDSIELALNAISMEKRTDSIENQKSLKHFMQESISSMKEDIHELDSELNNELQRIGSTLTKSSKDTRGRLHEHTVAIEALQLAVKSLLASKKQIDRKQSSSDMLETMSERMNLLEETIVTNQYETGIYLFLLKSITIFLLLHLNI